MNSSISTNYVLIFCSAANITGDVISDMLKFLGTQTNLNVEVIDNVI